MNQRILVDTGQLEWTSGVDVVNSLPESWRLNLGPAELVADAYARYEQKTLRLDSATTRRLDLVRLNPGYRDPTYAYHDTAEECFALTGEVTLGGEGAINAGDYFWRPPGWVHAAWTERGWTALLGVEGRCDGESGPASRRICPDDQAGTNQLFPGEEQLASAIGPRGWIRKLETRLVAWQAGPLFARGQGALAGWDLEHAAFKLLSRNPASGHQTCLVQLAPGYRQAAPGAHTVGVDMYVVAGSASLGSTRLGEGTYLYRPPGQVEEALRSEQGALLYLKSDGWLDFQIA